MTSNRTWKVFLAIVSVAVLALTACSRPAETPTQKAEAAPTQQQADPSKPVDGGTLTIGTTSDIVTLNPFTYDDVASGDVIQLVFASLYDIDATGNLTADEWALAAELPKVSADQKTYTIKLKSGPKWSDGTPITASDVAFTYNTFANPAVGSPSHSSFATIKEARAKDATTVEIELKEVDARFALNALNSAIVPEKPFKGVKPEEIGKQPYGTDIKATITSGPYLWKEWAEKQYQRLERDPNYWGKKPNIQTVVFKIYADQNTAAQAIMQGEIDFYGNAPVPQLEAIKNTKGLKVASSAGPIYDYLGFNLLPQNWPDKFVPFAGKKTRQAISYAINRKGLVDTVLKGYGTLLNGPFLPGSWAYTEGTSFNYPFDPAKAKALLAEDGWTAGPDGLLVKDGHKFEFDMLYRGDNKRRADYALVIQQNLKDVGIKVNIKPMDFSALIPNHVNPGKFQGYLGGWQLALDPDAESIFSSNFFPEAGQNSGWYKNEKTDKLWADGYKTADTAKRKAIYAEIAREFSDDPPYVFLCQTNYNTVYNERVRWADADKPIHALPYGYMFHIQNWWVSK